MRIVHVETGRHLYGGGRQVLDLVAGLAAAGVDNVLVCTRGGELEAAARGARHAVRGARVVGLPMRGELDFAFPARLRRVLRETSPDLVHVHSRRGADHGGAAATWLERVPAVLTRRVDADEPASWARLKYSAYIKVIALSRAIESQLATHGVARERIARIPSAVDPARFRPDPEARARLAAAFDLAQGALVVGVVAQLIPRKGHRALLAELPELARLHPSLRVLCFGRGPLEPELRAEIAALGLEGRVLLAGFREDLPSLLPGLDVLAHPAEREGLGLALLEAASSGVPVVACAAGGVPDVVDDGRTGLLVPAGDGPGLRGALGRLLADPAERARLGGAARARVEQRFTVDRMVAAHRALYAAVLERRAAAATAGRGAREQAAAVHSNEKQSGGSTRRFGRSPRE
ncbi:MAG TPA: glycosyltransferase [Gammaproteobacteria bacterium]|nr:glycosyltransferase [Gammaproteobacteria bacterium]